MPVTRPRRALLEELEDAEQVVRYAPRRSSGHVPAAEPSPVEIEAAPDEVQEPAPRPRRALPALPDADDVEEMETSWASLDLTPRRVAEVSPFTEPEDGPPTVVPGSRQAW